MPLVRPARHPAAGPDMTSRSARPEPKRKWFQLALRHLRMAQRLLDSGFPDGAAFRDASGKSGRQNRIMPYVPIFRSTPARMTEPAVGASTCASGSHVCNGNSGTLIAKATKKARNNSISVCGIRTRLPACSTRWRSF